MAQDAEYFKVVEAACIRAITEYDGMDPTGSVDGLTMFAKYMFSKGAIWGIGVNSTAYTAILDQAIAEVESGYAPN